MPPRTASACTQAHRLPPLGGNRIMTTTPRARPVEFEARAVLDSLGYHALNFNGSRSPINLVGIGDDDVLLVQVRRERLRCGTSKT
ncbi:MAG: hypothetical protein A4E39_00948 [Methanoregulaceae archaeon PtaB.Bin152]|nr:MAG: hypothetical protein A4E39_00948 [Methanoregulaceae archaeon PtaB.Bin152]